MWSTAVASAAVWAVTIAGSRTPEWRPLGGDGVYDDFHYPDEEPAERAALELAVPKVLSVDEAKGSAVVTPTGTVTVGDVVPTSVGEWHVMSVVGAAQTPAYVVFEAEMQRWGLLAYSFVQGSHSLSPVTIRKSVGRLASIQQPYFNFTARFGADYFANAAADPTDLPSKIAANLTRNAYGDPEPAFVGLAAVMAPQRDIVALGNARDVVKFCVTHTGRVKCGSRGNTDEQTEGGIVELQDQRSPPPNKQTIVFDPAKHLKFWPNRYQASKAGLLGGFLNVANVGSFSSSVNQGFELVAFVPSPLETSVTTLPEHRESQNPPCSYSDPIRNAYIPKYPAGYSRSFEKLVDAEQACNGIFTCGGITLRNGRYELRASAFTLPSPMKEISWLVTNASKQSCHILPRLKGLNYSPEVLVRFRPQEATSWRSGDAVQYFSVSNSTAEAPDVISATKFYEALLARKEEKAHALTGTMNVNLPGQEGQRQVDAVAVALLSASDNYVGNQSNYGFGATYWSYGREDNGSLPLNVLSVDDALLDWGFCRLTKAHMGFYFDNYVQTDGSINFYTWGSRGDSVGDLGRLVDLYVKIVRLCDCEVDGWAELYLGAVEAVGRRILSLQSAQRRVKAPPGADGLLQGAPEHDWSGTTDRYFYNNNVWVQRGMQVLGEYMKRTTGCNASLGAALLAGAAQLQTAIAKSVTACAVKDDRGIVFLPPAATVNSTPYASMTASREASYSNFRFFSEPLLASVLPPEVEAGWVEYHNARGGRMAGVSRWQSHLDDMPTAGWGWGALAANRTQDFLALIYGQMATYTSRGSFHSTEQLSFEGEGLYRDLMGFPDPLPPINGREVHEGSSKHFAENRLEYYGPENDVSFCIVSEVLVARLTRWQLVFEELYRAETLGVWLARGAPRRWYSAGGFGVKSAPTTFGRVDYSVRPITGNSSAVFSVTVKPSPRSVPLTSQLWRLRFPASTGLTSVCTTGCAVDALDSGTGVVAVRLTASAFTVQAHW